MLDLVPALIFLIFALSVHCTDVPTVSPSFAPVPSPTLYSITTYAGNGGSGHTDGVAATTSGISAPNGVWMSSVGSLYVCSYGHAVVRVVDSDGIISLFAGSYSTGASGDGGPASSAQINGPYSVWGDSLGIVYVVENLGHRVRLVNSGIISLFSGTGAGSFSDGMATSSYLNYPAGVWGDSDGTVYIADVSNQKIRKITSGIMSTVVGGGSSTSDDVKATTATLSNPYGVMVDTSSNIYFTEYGGHKARLVASTTQLVSTIAGTGTTVYNGDGLPATSLTLYSPLGIVVDTAGVAFIGDNHHYRVRSIVSGVMYTIAGTGVAQSAGDGGMATSASLQSAYYVAADRFSGSIYLGDPTANVVRKLSDLSPTVVPTVSPSLNPTAPPTVQPSASLSQYSISTKASGFSSAYGMWMSTSDILYVCDGNVVYQVSTDNTKSTFAGSTAGSSGDGGPASSALLNSAYGIWGNSMGTLYVSEKSGHKVRAIVLDSTIISTYAGTGTAGSSDGNALTSPLNEPRGLWGTTSGSLYIAENGARKIKVVNTDGNLVKIVGTGEGLSYGDGGVASYAALNNPHGVFVDTALNIYITEYFGARIRFVTSNSIISLYAGTGTSTANGVAATSTSISNPVGVAMDSSGVVLFSVGSQYKIRSVSNGLVYTVAGTGSSSYSGENGFATSAGLTFPYFIAVDVNPENLYCSEASAVRKLSKYYSPSASPSMAPSLLPSPDPTVSPSWAPTCIPTQLPSTQSPSFAPVLSPAVYAISRYSGNGGSSVVDGVPATSSGMGSLNGVWMNTLGSLYVCSDGNNAVRVIDSEGIIALYAGSYSSGSSGDGGPATSAKLISPIFAWGNTLGSIFVSDSATHRIREVTSAQIINTVAGTGSGTFGDGVATSSFVNVPYGMWGTTTGSLYFADNGNNRIRLLFNGILSTITGSSAGSTGDGGDLTAAKVNSPKGIFVDVSLNLYVADYNGSKLRLISTSASSISTIAGTGGTAITEDGLAATSTTMTPLGVLVNTNGVIFVVDLSHVRIKMISSNVAYTIAGSSSSSESTGDGGLATAATFVSPRFVAANADENLFISESTTNVVRRMIALTSSPTSRPTGQPSGHPSTLPSSQPTCTPTVEPTRQPSSQPSSQPFRHPTGQPTCAPSIKPSSQPSSPPSRQPFQRPSSCPSSCPTGFPSNSPTSQPSRQPTVSPTVVPSRQPSSQPSGHPSSRPSSWPSSQPSGRPSSCPSFVPIGQPTTQPMAHPSSQPSGQPVSAPSSQPSLQPSSRPTIVPRPSVTPTPRPTLTFAPTVAPSTSYPTVSDSPTTKPTTSIPTLSVQPTIQPSTAGPTVSFQPSLRPTTVRPSVSESPTVRPTTVGPTLSLEPTRQPTSARPSVSELPSVQPSTVFPTVSAQPTVSNAPTERPSTVPTMLPSSSMSPSLPLGTSWPPSLSPTASPTDAKISVIGLSQKFRIVLPFLQASRVYGQTLKDISLEAGGEMGTNYLVKGNSVETFEMSQAGPNEIYSDTVGVDVNGRSVSIIDDFNGDGRQDLIIGDPFAARCYVLLGNNNEFTDMTVSFTIFGESESDLTGWSVSDAGDVNNDTLHDIIIGAPNARDVGAFYVVYGTDQLRDVHLDNLSASAGFAVYGGEKADCLGLVVSNAGDVNRDGYDDVVVGALLTSLYYSGAAYLVYGGSALAAISSVASLSSSAGIKFSGSFYSLVGHSVAAAGDVNGDGYDDVLIGSNPQKTSVTAAVYLLYGGLNLLDVMVKALTSSQGSILSGVTFAVGSVGDMDGDGKSDFMVGAGYDYSQRAGLVVYTDLVTLKQPTLLPTTLAPTVRPSRLPSLRPTCIPSVAASRKPTAAPSVRATLPSVLPSQFPVGPSELPTSVPSTEVPVTEEPSESPTEKPSVEPSEPPTELPSATQTLSPTFAATLSPTASQPPTPIPIKSRKPFSSPTFLPSAGTFFPTLYSEVSIEGDSVEVYDRHEGATILHLNTTTNLLIRGHAGGYKFDVSHNPGVTLTIESFNTSCDVIDLSQWSEYSKKSDLTVISGSLIVVLNYEQELRLVNLTPVDFDEVLVLFGPKVRGSEEKEEEDTIKKAQMSLMTPFLGMMFIFLVMLFRYLWINRRRPDSAQLLLTVDRLVKAGAVLKYTGTELPLHWNGTEAEEKTNIDEDFHSVNSDVVKQCLELCDEDQSYSSDSRLSGDLGRNHDGNQVAWYSPNEVNDEESPQLSNVSFNSNGSWVDC